MSNLTTCSACGKCYEAGSEEQANEPRRFCRLCWRHEETRLALAEALSVLRAINSNRHAPTTDGERAAVAELERVIALCGRTLDWPVRP